MILHLNSNGALDCSYRISLEGLIMQLHTVLLTDHRL